jgi:hypothetical protein
MENMNNFTIQGRGSMYTQEKGSSEVSLDPIPVCSVSVPFLLRCVWEVALDNVDMCVGDFWETSERRQLAPMTISIAIDLFSLVSKVRVLQFQRAPRAWHAARFFAPRAVNMCNVCKNGYLSAIPTYFHYNRSQAVVSH